MEGKIAVVKVINNSRPAEGRPRPKVTILPSGYMLQKIWGAFVTSFNADQWELRI